DQICCWNEIVQEPEPLCLNSCQQKIYPCRVPIGHEVAGCVRPAPSASIVFGLGRRGGVVGKSRFQLRFNLNEIVGLGLEVARMGPLEACLEQASNPPIGIAEVIVDGWILGLELDGAFELLDR